MEARVLILGGGPAGLSAALWLRNLGLAPLVVEASDRLGGLQNLNFLANDWVLGQRDQTGPVLAARFAEHAAASGATLLTGWRLAALAGRAGDFRARLRRESGEEQDLACAAVLLATGTRYRAAEVLANVAGMDRIPPERIAYGPWAFADLARRREARVLIVGGGDNAFENARLLLKGGARVTLAVRAHSRAQQALVAAVRSDARCLLLQPAMLESLAEGPEGLAATLATEEGPRSVTVDRLHVLAGYEPNSRLVGEVFAPELAAAVALDAGGYIRVDSAGRTGAAGIYAAGDVCNPLFPSVVSAVALGALAAKTIELDLRRT